MTVLSSKLARNQSSLIALALLGLLFASPVVAESVALTPKAVESTRFRLAVDGEPVFVLKFKDVHYAHLPYSAADGADIAVTSRRALDRMEISPKAAKIASEFDPDTRTLKFRIPGAGAWVVTMDGSEHLFLFADPPARIPSDGISVLDYGADPNGASLSTSAIQKAIDDAPAGATVIVPPGHFISGSLFIKSDITFFLDAGALLQASGNPADFEPEQNAFIVIENADNASLSGRGTIDGSGAYLRHLTDTSGRLLAIRDSRNVQVEGVILRDARAWNTHIVRSEHVTLRNVKVINDRDVLNTDGINPDSSRQVLIEDSFFYCGDDAVAVKSTNRDGRFEDVYDIVVRNNVILTKKSALKVGTETHAAEMKDILFENNQVIESDRGMALYARDGTHMHDIRFIGNHFERPYHDYQQRLIDFRISERHGLSRISNVLIRDNTADATWAQQSQLIGLDEEHGISNVVFDNLVYAGKHCLAAEDANLHVGSFTKDVAFK